MRVQNLKQPVVATKSDWLAGTTWMGFTPRRDSLDSRNRTTATVQRQASGGYVLEYITSQFPRPNSGFEDDARYRDDRTQHGGMAGRLVAIHKLRQTSLPLVQIIGQAEFDYLQNLWAQTGDRSRWSVAFPIVESYEIVGWPLAKDVFGAAAFRRLYGHQSATLQRLTPDEQAQIAGLEILERVAPNAGIAVDQEIAAAVLSDIDPRLVRDIDRDLSLSAFEGESEERVGQYKRRAAWLAQRFVRERQRHGSLSCDACTFDPQSLIHDVRPRSLLDVHHKYPLSEGSRRSTMDDFALLCPTCHRLEHALLRQNRSLF